MSEFSSNHDIPNAELVAATPGGTVERIVPIPVAADRWTLLIVPIDGAAGPDPTFDLEYDVGGAFFPTNPATSATAKRDEANIITREDVVNRVKVKITNGGTVIIGDVLIRLFISRS